MNSSQLLEWLSRVTPDAVAVLRALRPALDAIQRERGPVNEDLFFALCAIHADMKAKRHA